MLTTTDIRTLVSCIDLTSLNADDTPERIAKLCTQAITPLGPVACVCIYPAFVPQAWKHLMETSVKIATVVNFPGGDESFEKITQTIQQAILDGASEIDAVIPQNTKNNNLPNILVDSDEEISENEGVVRSHVARLHANGLKMKNRLRKFVNPLFF